MRHSICSVAVVLTLIAVVCSPARGDARLDRRVPELNFSGQGLADVLDFMRDVSGVDIFVNWRELGAAGIKPDAPVKLKVKDEKFGEAIAKMLDAVSTDKGKAVATQVDGLIYISTAKDAMAKMTVTLPDEVNRQLPEVNFNSAKLSEVLSFLTEVSGLKFKMDWEALGKSGIKRDTPITTHLKAARLSTVLKLVLIDAGSAPTKATFADDTITITAEAPAPAAEKK